MTHDDVIAECVSPNESSPRRPPSKASRKQDTVLARSGQYMSLSGPEEILWLAHATGDGPVPLVQETEADRSGNEDEAKVKEGVSCLVDPKGGPQVRPIC